MKRIFPLLAVFMLLLASCASDSDGRTPADNISPVASFTATPPAGAAPLTVTFDASASHDTDGHITRYAWTIDGAELSTGVTTTHAFTTAGTFTVGLTVTDDKGATGTASKTISVATNGTGGDAVQIQASPAYLTYAGSSDATVQVTADGSWTAETQQDWLSVSPASGTGDATVSIIVNRSGLTPDHYAGSVLFKGASAREVVTIYMRFPNVTGSLTDPNGQIETSSTAMPETDPTSLPHVPGEVLVQLNPFIVALDAATSDTATEYGLLSGATLSQAAATLSPQAMQLASARLANDYQLSNAQPLAPGGSVFLMRSGTDLGNTLDQLAQDGRVTQVQPNYLNSHYGVPNDPSYPQQWHYDSINLPAAWEFTTGSPDVVIGVIDSAIDTSHPDLAGRLTTGYDFTTNTFSIGTPDDNHGTHVAGTIAAAGNNGLGVTGVNWNARIMPLTVLSNNRASNEDVYRAIVYAAGLCVYNSAGSTVCNDKPAQVINMSIGPDNPHCQPIPAGSILEEAVAFALGQGVTIVAAAGNNNCPVVGTPAAIPGVLAVSATSINNTKASYSNYGQEIWVTAPGGDTGNLVLSTFAGGSYGYAAGTSMASPHVAGVAALMKAANPDLTPTEIAFILRQTATDLGAPGHDPYYGHGLVNAHAAVQLARDLLTAHYPDFTVRIRSGHEIIRQVPAGVTGDFVLENLPAGSYTIEAGTDTNRNGVLGDPGEFYGSRNLHVSYEGDMNGIAIPVTPR